MTENKQPTQPYSMTLDGNSLTVKGVSKVVEVTEREAQLTLSSTTLIIKGEGINITRLDNEQGVVALQYTRLSSLSFRQVGVNLKGLFR